MNLGGFTFEYFYILRDGKLHMDIITKTTINVKNVNITVLRLQTWRHLDILYKNAEVYFSNIILDFVDRVFAWSCCSVSSLNYIATRAVIQTTLVALVSFQLHTSVVDLAVTVHTLRTRSQHLSTCLIDGCLFCWIENIPSPCHHFDSYSTTSPVRGFH